MIVAVSQDGVIGLDGTLPWHYPADLKRFKRLTVGQTVVMGRKTWESLPKKPLPNRDNIVVSSTLDASPGVTVVSSIEEALAVASTDEVWFIGGVGIFQGAMAIADVIDVTYVPDVIDRPEAVLFPPIDESRFAAEGRRPHPDDPRLKHQRFVARN